MLPGFQRDQVSGEATGGNRLNCRSPRSRRIDRSIGNGAGRIGNQPRCCRCVVLHHEQSRCSSSNNNNREFRPRRGGFPCQGELDWLPRWIMVHLGRPRLSLCSHIGRPIWRKPPVSQKFQTPIRDAFQPRSAGRSRADKRDKNVNIFKSGFAYTRRVSPRNHVTFVPFVRPDARPIMRARRNRRFSRSRRFPGYLTLYIYGSRKLINR